MLCVLKIEKQRTMFGQSLFASKSFFFLTVLVSAKDEYEQYFLLSRKKMSNVRKKISSVFMLVVLIDEKKIFLTRRFFNVSVGGLVFRRSSDFFRKRLSLCFFFNRYHRNTHQDDLLGNKMIATVLSS